MKVNITQLPPRFKMLCEILILEDKLEVPISELSDREVSQREKDEAKLNSLVLEFEKEQTK